ncbi:1675_t:CDS:2 [Diversispora eburnea]|uniref:1675_t:CDS:1 n=1 Tax=Diversispora eburnea TaxID=1213867 RepID=A0A9N8W603_9GLOM|nr:1675_t:CDS:2 [Diversispora eburnea]
MTNPESKKELLHFIKENISTIHFKTLRENEIEKSDDIKLAYMKHTLDDDPALFLSKWGKYLPPDHLSKFERLRIPPPVSRNLTPNARHNKQILNRRYRYLVTKLDSTSYFNDEAIESREPLLYENYVGQYLPEEKRHPPFPDDPDFDYDTVDFNEEFDDVETEEQDIQDKYFDNEPDDMEEKNTETGILDY